ncbi:MAG: hypothetical protein RBT62_05995 [Spirochaetia bacterium]|jgi:hypothetical protein|nr:hypothetical protein [Spirochaetia bacterium]
MNLDTEILSSILSTLITEAYEGPEDPRMTWFADNEPGCGLLGTLERLSATEASTPFSAGDAAGAATHAGHIVFALDLANRALRGENVHASAVWKDSWKYSSVDGQTWENLLVELREQYLALKDAVASGLPWGDQMNLTGLLGQLAHGAWHLGAIRQGLGLIRTPKS